MRAGENSLPSRTALSSASATFSAVLSLSRCARSCALSALVSALCAALMRRFSFLAASLASSFALALIARASARRVARLFRRLNRPIPAASRSSRRYFGHSCVAMAQHNTIARAPAVGCVARSGRGCTLQQTCTTDCATIVATVKRPL